MQANQPFSNPNGNKPMVPPPPPHGMMVRGPPMAVAGMSVPPHPPFMVPPMPRPPIHMANQPSKL